CGACGPRRPLPPRKPDAPIAYRISRFGMWIEVAGTPPVTDGKTMVPPPAPHVRTRLDSLAAAQDWLALLQEAERAGLDNILWLDPHRYVATAMSALGVMFNKCKDELLTATALHLKKVPTMTKLSFSDGTPFADGQTQMWIESEVTPVLAAGDGGGGGGPASALDEPLKEAKGLAMKGELGNALELVATAAASAPTPAERFRGRLALAQLCLSGGRHEIAKSALSGLAVEIEAHDLTTWDPALCGEYYACLYAATKGVNDDKRPPPGAPVAVAAPGQPGPPTGPTEEELAAERAAFERLCQLDPAAALKLAGSGTG
ncbi:MAG: type VI secretion system domain-containing protein, partial [Myxococcota bacterium]